VRVATVESREKQATKLVGLFEPKRGFLSKKTRDSMYQMIVKMNPLFDTITVKLAKDFLSDRPIERWCKPLDWLRYGDSDTHEPTHFYSRDEIKSLMDWGRGMTREYVKELRERKTGREDAVLHCLAAMLPKQPQIAGGR
jgi:hypothetical protein